MDEEVSPLDEIDGHFVREKGVLVVRRVEDAGRQEDDLRIDASGGRDFTQVREQHARIVVDWPDVIALEQLRIHLLDDLAIAEHVRDAARHAEIVLEHDKPSVGSTNEVGADDGQSTSRVGR